VDGLFHADPHPATSSSRTTVASRSLTWDGGAHGACHAENLLKMLMALSEGNGEAAAEIAIQMSEKLEDFAAPEFRRRITQLVALRRDQGLEQLNVGRSLLEVSSIARKTASLCPPNWSCSEDHAATGSGRAHPRSQFEPNASIQRNVAALMTQSMRKELTQGNLYSTLLEMKDFTVGLPQGSTGSWTRSPTPIWR